MRFIGIVLFLALLIACPIFYFTFCIWRPYIRPPEAKTLTTLESIRLLLDPPSTTIQVLLRRRALPNARFIRAFGIHNSTFTSPSTRIRSLFRKYTATRLKNLDTLETWQTLGEVIRKAVEFYLPDDPTAGDYAAYMQAVVFVTVLAAFFDHEIDFPEATNVHFVTEGINALWMASKSPEFKPASPMLSRISQNLKCWLPDNLMDPFRDNPLEIILPAYETLWRLVANAFTYVEGVPTYTVPFLEFFDNPTATQFETQRISGVPSAQHIMQEVLRLHPPVKRIKRAQDEVSSIAVWIPRRLLQVAGFHCDPACSNTVAADIEALQTSAVWGPSPHEFDAMRHVASTQTQKECFMPFGLGPLKCMASSLAPRLAAMIVAGVAERNDIGLIRGEYRGGREGWEGWKICKRS